MDVEKVDVVIIGAGAAGLMCAIEAGKRGRSVIVLEHNDRVGEKIRISGGGRCNFTNISADYSNFISTNPHFCKSAFARFTPNDFIAMIERHTIAYHEKKLGQLFCDDSSRQIIDMLERECDDAEVDLFLNCTVLEVKKNKQFMVHTNRGILQSESLVIATGGLSIPKLGATNFGYETAKQFGVAVTNVKPGLVPFIFDDKEMKLFQDLSGVSIDAVVKCQDVEFRENILFTHKGLSGPAILQISSYWNDGDSLTINVLPECDIYSIFKEAHDSNQQVITILQRFLPKRFAQKWCEVHELTKPLRYYSLKQLQQITNELYCWTIIPKGTEGYEKAEVTAGGVDTRALSSKTMEVKNVPGLYFIGEVVDVTGWLGGYNFQWAWASGFVAGQYA
jgi:predicted Rossmann fold flavoprotein